MMGYIESIHESVHFLARCGREIRVKNLAIGLDVKQCSFTPEESETEFAFLVLPFGLAEWKIRFLNDSHASSCRTQERA